MSGARTGGGIKHKRAELCLKGLISILFLQQCVTVLSLPRAETTQEENVKALHSVLPPCTSHPRRGGKGAEWFTNGVLKFRLGVSRRG